MPSDPWGEKLTCQTKMKGALLSLMDGRKREMWKVGSLTETRFKLTSLPIVASGSICSAKNRLTVPQ